MRNVTKPTKYENDVSKINRSLWIKNDAWATNLWITWENLRKPREWGILSVDNCVESVDLSPGFPHGTYMGGGVFIHLDTVSRGNILRKITDSTCLETFLLLYC